jgi:DNA-binding response OmpR family regulator
MTVADDTQQPARGRRVLVVDDDPSIRKMVTTALQRHGFTVDTAGDGVEALAKLEEGAYELLVLDLMMPRLDGFGVLERLEESQSDASAGSPRPKILIMTAAGPSILQKLPRERVAAILTKPFDLRMLIDNAELLSPGTPPVN